MLNIKKEVTNLKRFNEIILILFEEGFDYVIDSIKLKHKVPKGRINRTKKITRPEVRLRKTLERLGPTFIKFGQVLGVRPDLLPKDYVKELEKLQDKVPEFSYSKVKNIIETELGKPLEKIFKSFEKKPIASASISQVHKATLRSGKVVAVKVQRPNVHEIMRKDIKIIKYLAYLLEEHFNPVKKYEPGRIVKEFEHWTNKELDFLLEARNAKIFARNFSENPSIRIPKVYEDHTTSKVLTLQFIYGTELNKIDELKKRKVDVRKVIKTGFDAVLTQVFLHGFFHADPHPGNIIVTRHEEIAFIDFGIIGQFSEDLKEKSIDLLYSLVFHDVDKLVTVLEDLGMDDDSDINYLKQELRAIVEPAQVRDLKDIKLSKTIEEVLHLALQHNLKLPLEFSLLGKTIITLEGLGLQYDPKFRLIENARPFVENLMLRRMSPYNILKTFMKNSFKIKKFAETFPDEANKALRKIEKGEIKVDLSDTDIKRLSMEIDRSSNRISYSMLITGFVITGALTLGIDLGPKIFSVPFISFICFFVSLILTIMLFISIIKEKKVIIR